MTDKLRTALTILAILATLYVWGNCRESAGASKQRLRDSTTVVNAHSHATDLRVSRLAAESLELGARLMRLQRNDSVARTQIARLMAQISRGGRLAEPQPANLASADEPVTTSTDQAAPAPPVGCAGAPTACDTLIATLLESRAAVDTQLTLWRALAVERGDLLQRALLERNSFRDIARAWEGKAGKRLGCTGGASALASISGHVSAGVGVTCGIRF